MVKGVAEGMCSNGACVAGEMHHGIHAYMQERRLLKWAVRILLECILVKELIHFNFLKILSFKFIQLTQNFPVVKTFVIIEPRASRLR